MSATHLDQLRAAAGAAERAEAEFRRYAEQKLDKMMAERVRAHRRYHLVNDMVERARPIADGPACIAAQVASALAQAGWSESDAAYGEIYERLGRVAVLVHDDLHGEPNADRSDAGVLSALAVFEDWYRARFGSEFPALLPRTPGNFQPLVDF